MTVEDFLMQAKEDGLLWADSAIKNAETLESGVLNPQNEVVGHYDCYSMADALQCAFSWMESPEGFQHWYEIFDLINC